MLLSEVARRHGIMSQDKGTSMRKSALITILGMAGLAAAGLPLAGTQAQTAAPTFSKDVAPIFYKNCVSCHRPGEMAPMALITYSQVRPWVRSIRTKIADASMPPWHAEAVAGTFRNERRLTEAERATILAWVDGGAPEGEARSLPPVPQFATGWTVGTPDAVISLPRDYEVPAAGEIPYQYFRAATNFTEDKWVQAIEIRPGARRAVHHVLVYSREPNPSARTAAFRPANPNPLAAAGGRAQALGALVNAAQERRGAANSRGELIATTAPGTNAMVFPAGQALLIKAGSVLTFQMHYTANGTAAKDRTSVGFVFAKQRPEKEVFTSAFVNAAFIIPAGAANHRVDSAIEFVQDAQILAIFPHTHLRGKSWEYRMVYPDGRSEVVLAAPKYDFNWQTYYEFTKPLTAVKGSRLEATAHYDNSANNRSNPDPKVNVRWGDQTWEEMQYTGITFVVNGPGL
jgi:hypothetical protein